jgi:hypothetical protein
VSDPIHRFRGTIAGVGSTEGVRVVVGWWRESPYGGFADVMLAEPDGTRVLLAPSDEIARFVAGTYTFDRIEVVPVEVRRDGVTVRIRAGALDAAYDVGRRTPLGVALRLVPARLATAPGWTRVTDPLARRLLRGVRTRGSAGNGRVETYGATDLHRIDGLRGTWEGRGLGDLAPVTPEPGFGFGSTPVTPSVTSLVTTVVDPHPTSLNP